MRPTKSEIRPRQGLLIILIGAMLLQGLGLTLSFQRTFDAFVHLFFADHYARDWFNLWEDRWYTGFSVTAYPPLVHQLLALLSLGIGLKASFVVLGLLVVAVLILGVYRLARLWVSEPVAQVAAALTALTPSILEALHVFGQLPTLLGMGLLCHALPGVYDWIRNRNLRSLVVGLALIGATVASHHVTPLFGMVFFVVPVALIALFDRLQLVRPSLRQWAVGVWQNRLSLSVVFGGILFLLGIVILPYWQHTIEQPIRQVPIPHGSRDSFVEVPSSGLLFFLIPLGTSLLALPYVLRRLATYRNLPMGLSLLGLLVLGTGGTTPLPRLLLGNGAYQILTLERFTFWASIVCIPFVANWLYLLWITRKRWLLYGFGVLLTAQTIYVIHLATFRQLQPPALDMKPLVDFLQTDQHRRWRYLTLGFGDQMAWLSAQTTAQTVDGNYHSARRLPELTRYPVERLENAKFKGIAGVQSLRDFLTNGHHYALKYVFSNDKFYDPLLYFSGWERVQRLDNGVVLWQKPDVPPLALGYREPSFTRYQQWHWGLVPMATLLLALAGSLLTYWQRRKQPAHQIAPAVLAPDRSWRWQDGAWPMLLLIVGIGWVGYRLGFSAARETPMAALQTYYHHLDRKEFEETYACFSRASRPRYERYLLDLSRTDGLLASYARFDTLAVLAQTIRQDTAWVTVRANWITPVQPVSVTVMHRLVAENGQWLLIPEQEAPAFLPDRFLPQTQSRVYLAGKRQLSTEPAPHDDLMDRPEIQLVSANLVQQGNRTALVGELLNQDHLPAHMTLEGVFYGADGRVLSRHSVGDVLVYTLLPQEHTFFRIDYNGPPNRHPTNFRLEARAVVSGQALYRHVAVQGLRQSSGHQLTGTLLNGGTAEVTIPAVLSAWRDRRGRLLWADRQYLRQSLLPQRQIPLVVDIPPIQGLRMVRVGVPAQWRVNGKQASEAGVALAPADTLRLANGLTCQLNVNAYIGNPK